MKTLSNLGMYFLGVVYIITTYWKFIFTVAAVIMLIVMGIFIFVRSLLWIDPLAISALLTISALLIIIARLLQYLECP